MMRDYLIISDSHGNKSRLDDVISYRRSLLKSDEVLDLIFLGDGLGDLFSSRHYDSIISHAVRGNCDATDRFSPYGEEIPLYSVMGIGSHKALLCHGHTLSVKYGYDELCREASRLGADIAIFGHTHLPTLEYIKKGSIRGVDRDITIFNPGALSSFEGSFGNLCVSDGGILFSHGRFHNISRE